MPLFFELLDCPTFRPFVHASRHLPLVNPFRTAEIGSVGSEVDGKVEAKRFLDIGNVFIFAQIRHMKTKTLRNFDNETNEYCCGNRNI